MCNDTPFAVIHRITCYGDSLIDGCMVGFSENPTGEYLIVRGLKVIPISCDVDVKAVKNVNKRAQRVADSLYSRIMRLPVAPK